MGFYLLENRGSRPANWYASRRSPLRVIVMHITAGLEDLDTVNDHSAENTARYAATVTDRQVSWHAGADADSYLYLLPASYTAFHCRNYNSFTYGVEISKRHVKWAGMDPKWVQKTLWNAARAVAPICVNYKIPRRLLTKAQVDAGGWGFTAHAFLDPTRRSDPGADFPWTLFFPMVDEIIAGTPDTIPTITPEATNMFMFWHDNAVHLIVGGKRRGYALAPKEVDGLKAVGIPLLPPGTINTKGLMDQNFFPLYWD